MAAPYVILVKSNHELSPGTVLLELKHDHSHPFLFGLPGSPDAKPLKEAVQRAEKLARGLVSPGEQIRIGLGERDDGLKIITVFVQSEFGGAYSLKKDQIVGGSIFLVKGLLYGGSFWTPKAIRNAGVVVDAFTKKFYESRLHD